MPAFYDSVISVTTSAVVVFLLLAGLWFTGAIINAPNFHPKLTLAAPTIGYMRLMLRLMLTGPAGLRLRFAFPAGRRPAASHDNHSTGYHSKE